jgi:hypothetical protein
MEIVVTLGIVGAAVYWFFFRKEKTTEVSVPYKVKAPAVETASVAPEQVVIVPEAVAPAAVVAPKAKAPAKAKEAPKAKAPAKPKAAPKAKAPAKPKAAPKLKVSE